MPPEPRVRKALDELLGEATETGTVSSVLALARLFGLSNTTFRRHFPDIAQHVSDACRNPPRDTPATSGAARYDRQVAREAKLRRANGSLTDHLKVAAASIHRLSIENHQLREQLEAAFKVTRIDRPSRRSPQE